MSFNALKRTPLRDIKGPITGPYEKKLDVNIDFPEDSLVTDQSFGEEADINTIMARYQSTGEMPILNEQGGQWLDVTEMDFQRHMDFIIEAQGIFDQLPSDLRDRFGNDPGAFLGFCSDENNRPEMARLGLLNENATTAAMAPPKAQKPVPEDDF